MSKYFNVILTTYGQSLGKVNTKFIAQMNKIYPSTCELPQQPGM